MVMFDYPIPIQWDYPIYIKSHQILDEAIRSSWPNEAFHHREPGRGEAVQKYGETQWETQKKGNRMGMWWEI